MVYASLATMGQKLSLIMDISSILCVKLRNLVRNRLVQSGVFTLCLADQMNRRLLDQITVDPSSPWQEAWVDNVTNLVKMLKYLSCIKIIQI